MAKNPSTQRSGVAQEAEPPAHLVHRTAHRMRLKVPSKRHDAAFFAHLEKQLEAIPKIESTLVTPKTASVLLSFAEGDGNGIAAALDALGLVSVVDASVDETTDPAAQAQPGFASGRADRRALAFTVFLLLLLRQLLKGGWLAPGLAFTWFLLELLRAHRPQQNSPVAEPAKGHQADRR